MDKKLDKFESFIKNSMDNYEAPHNEASWDAIEQSISNPSKFESFVKESMDTYEAPYHSSSWTAVEKVLNGTKTPFYKSIGFIGGVAAVLVAGIVYFSLPQNSSNTNEVALNNKNVNSNTKNSITNNSIEEPNINKTNNTTENNVIEASSNSTPSSSAEKNTNNPTDGSPDDTFLDGKDNSNDINPKNDVTIDEAGTKTDLSSEKTDSPENKEDLLEKADKSDDKLNIPNSSSETKEYNIGFDLNPTYCEGDDIKLQANANTEDLTYTWLINNKEVSNRSSYTVNASTGNMNITLIAKENNKAVNEITKNIEVTPKPNATIYDNEDKYALVNKHSFSLNENFKTTTWNINGETFEGNNVPYTFPRKNYYTITSEVINDNGCTATLTKEIFVNGYYNIRPDQFFTPDGNGSLDVFMPEELTVINQPFTMNIYRRSGGAPIFSTSSISNGWDGANEPYDAFVYEIKLVNELGNEETYIGTVVKARK